MPSIGETWEIGDPYGRTTRGIIAEITDTRVTLVALTGARSNVPTSRFEGWWRFIAAPPKTRMRCSHCKDSGILSFQRGVSPEYVCPRHLPVGVLATLHTAGETVERAETPPRLLIQCPECGNPDPVEDARLGLLGRGEFGWWTCPRCSTRWGLVSEPKDTDNKGRWYIDTVSELTETMLESGEIQRIECSRSAWHSIAASSKDIDNLTVKVEVVPDSGFPIAEFNGIPLHMVASLTDGSVLVRAKIAPAGGTISRRPVQKLGGIGGRSAPARTPVLETMIGILSDTDLSSSPDSRNNSTHHPLDGLITAFEDVPTAPARPSVVLPSVGSKYVERRSGKEVEVTRVEDNDGRWAVALRDTSYTTVGTAPRILGINDFNAEFVRSGRPVTEPPPPPVVPIGLDIAEGSEWFDFGHNEYVTVISTNLIKMTALLKGGSTGRTRNEVLQNFTDSRLFKKVVRLTAHQRLMTEDDE